jgi:hypothetical protein
MFRRIYHLDKIVKRAPSSGPVARSLNLSIIEPLVLRMLDNRPIPSKKNGEMKGSALCG